MKKFLCLSYSRTGHTKNIMSVISENLSAESVEYTDGSKRKGVLGYLKA